MDIATEQQLLTQDQPYANHNGGMIAFGPDGYLYIGLGDGGSGGDPQGNGQNARTLLGKILRIDATVRCPDAAAQPLRHSRRQPVRRIGHRPVPTRRPEIWAYGPAQPLALQLRPRDRRPVDRRRGPERVGGDRLRARRAIPGEGYNFGWNVLEGTHPYAEGSTPDDTAEFTPPIVEYDRAAGHSVTGGYVYRGTRLPGARGHVPLRRFRQRAHLGPAAKRFGHREPPAARFGPAGGLVRRRR